MATAYAMAASSHGNAFGAEAAAKFQSRDISVQGALRSGLTNNSDALLQITRVYANDALVDKTNARNLSLNRVARRVHHGASKVDGTSSTGGNNGCLSSLDSRTAHGARVGIAT